jgi:hypothetical protein
MASPKTASLLRLKRRQNSTSRRSWGGSAALVPTSLVVAPLKPYSSLTEMRGSITA